MSARLSRSFDWERLAREAGFRPALMAALCPISLRQLERIFEKEFNRTPSRWMMELKCRLALRLVARGWSNKAIVAELGFASESHLCHAFKRVYGKPPQAFGPFYECGKLVRRVTGRRWRRVRLGANGRQLETVSV